MTDIFEVTIADIRALANTLCDAVEARGQAAVQVQARHYWCVYFADMFAASQPTPVVGDIADDLADARRDLMEATDTPAIWHAAHHLSGLIQLVAYADTNNLLVPFKR